MARWEAQPKENGAAAWTCDKADAKLLAKVMRDNGLKVKIKTLRQRWAYDYTYYTVHVIGSTHDVLRGREIRRGFKVAMTLRGEVFDFMLGMRAGLNARELCKSRLATSAESKSQKRIASIPFPSLSTTPRSKRPMAALPAPGETAR